MASRSRSLLVFVLVSLSACGSRSGLGVESAPGVDAAVTDAAPRLPPRLRDRWWFNTVRALCDTFAIELCEDGRVMTRLSLNDACAGDAPVTDAPVEAPVTWVSDTDFVLLVSAPAVGPPFDVPMRLVPSDAGPLGDRIELLDTGGLPSAVWSDGVRASTVPFAIPDDFVFCD